MDESCLFHDEWMAEILTFAAARNLRDGLPEEVRWSYAEEVLVVTLIGRRHKERIES